ncbi:MAG: HK97-gp10 family putative phage morphogenesis protein [Paracoccus sp. (in: a-proteobacteria)]
MAQQGVQIKWKIVQNDFPKIAAALLPAARAIVAKTALDLEAHAKSRAPVDTGTLKNSIQATQVGGNGVSGSVRWRVVVGADYGMYVEWGTVHMAAQPFFQPAIQAVTPQFLRAIRSLI